MPDLLGTLRSLGTKTFHTCFPAKHLEVCPVRVIFSRLAGREGRQAALFHNVWTITVVK